MNPIVSNAVSKKLCISEKNSNLKPKRWSLVVHGGAGAVPHSLSEEKIILYKQKLNEAAQVGSDILEAGGSATDAVVGAIKVLEDCELFNAGKGSALASDGVAYLDASIAFQRPDANICPATHHHFGIGGVGCITTPKNPIELARIVMKHTNHHLICGPGADQLAKLHNLKTVDNSYFVTPERLQQLEKRKNRKSSQKIADDPTFDLDNFAAPTRGDTVGCVALDMSGEICSGLSTGGIGNKVPGRVGDSPLYGAGFFVNIVKCGVCGTGTGETFIRSSAATKISTLMQYCNLSLLDATRCVLYFQGSVTQLNKAKANPLFDMNKHIQKYQKMTGAERLQMPLTYCDGGFVGIEAGTGNIVIEHNTPSMFHSYASRDQYLKNKVNTTGAIWKLINE